MNSTTRSPHGASFGPTAATPRSRASAAMRSRLCPVSAKKLTPIPFVRSRPLAQSSWLRPISQLPALLDREAEAVDVELEALLQVAGGQRDRDAAQSQRLGELAPALGRRGGG